MNDWRILLAKNCLKAAVPFKNQARMLRAKLGFGVVPLAKADVINGVFIHTHALREIGFSLHGKRALEIASGTHPVLPLMFRLAGCDHVTMLDGERRMLRRNVLATVALLRERKLSILRDLPCSEEHFEKVLGVDLEGGLDDVLTSLGLAYRMSQSGWKKIKPVDLVLSHSALEHIEPGMLLRFFMESRNHLRPDAVMSHYVDHTDHRARPGGRLSQIDFLRYSDKVWRLLCVHPQDYTNRLRHSDYVVLFADTRFEIAHQVVGESERMAVDAAVRPLWGRFAKMDVSDLATASTLFIVRPIKTSLDAKGPAVSR